MIDENMENNFRALGQAWREDWSDFDGRQLRTQIEEILAGEDAGVEFYHSHMVEASGWGRETCAGFGCETCKPEVQDGIA